MQNSSQQEFSSFKLLEICFYPGLPRPAGEIIFSICVSLMKNPGGGIAEHHTLEAVSESQPLKHNGERALTPAVHCQIRPAITVPAQQRTPQRTVIATLPLSRELDHSKRSGLHRPRNTRSSLIYYFPPIAEIDQYLRLRLANTTN